MGLAQRPGPGRAEEGGLGEVVREQHHPQQQHERVHVHGVPGGIRAVVEDLGGGDDAGHHHEDGAHERASGAIQLGEGQADAGDEDVGEQEDGEGQGGRTVAESLLVRCAVLIPDGERGMAGTDRHDGPVELDGSEGEGGGQILRSALSLSLITGRPFHMTHVRANREPPGLRPQHLACVRGAEALSGGRSEGAEVGASELRFEPGPVRPGDYVLEVGTAGSTPLLFQCLFYPAGAGGGRLAHPARGHAPAAQPQLPLPRGVWLPVAKAYGLNASLRLVHAGFYPQGAGEFIAEVDPVREPPSRVDLPARGTLRDISVGSFVGGLPFGIAERQSKAAVAALRERGIYSQAENRPLPTTHSVGTVTFILAQFENTIAGFTALGKRGRPAEDVGREAAEEVARFMESGGALDEHLGDQILLPAALLAAGKLGPASPGTTRYTTARVTEHLTTHARRPRALPAGAGDGGAGRHGRGRSGLSNMR